MASEAVVSNLTELKRRVGDALHATSEVALVGGSELLEELGAAIEELEVAADALIEADRHVTYERMRFQELFEGAPDGYVSVDRDGVVVDANRAASLMLRVDQQELQGKPFQVFLAQGERVPLHHWLDRVVKGNGTPSDWETTVCPRGGPGFRAWVRAIVAHDAEGRVAGSRLLIRDISDKVRAAELERLQRNEEATQLRAYAVRKEELQRHQAEFLNLVSHELRAPLGLIRGYLSMMADGTLGEVSEDTARVVPVVLQKCDEMSRLVEQALQTARLVDTERQLALQDADLAEIVSRAVSAMLPFAAMAGREIHTAGITRRIPVIVDPEKVHTIVVNLIDNAIKYSSSGTPVQCTVERRGRLATVSVEDRGPGIPRDQLPRLFSQFGRLKTPTRVGGVGLGLYLSRMLARLHHGDLEVDSVEGAGSTFTLMLPAGRRPASRAELAPAAHG